MSRAISLPNRLFFRSPTSSPVHYNDRKSAQIITCNLFWCTEQCLLLCHKQFFYFILFIFFSSARSNGIFVIFILLSIVFATVFVARVLCTETDLYSLGFYFLRFVVIIVNISIFFFLFRIHFYFHS